MDPALPPDLKLEQIFENVDDIAADHESPPWQPTQKEKIGRAHV